MLEIYAQQKFEISHIMFSIYVFFYLLVRDEKASLWASAGVYHLLIFIQISSV